MSEKKESDKKKPKAKTPEITDPVKVDFEPTLSDSTIDEEFIEDLQEVMTIAGRLKRRQQMRRYKSRMLIARKRAMKRRATQARIGVRARRGAVSSVKRRLAGGRSSSQLTYSERARVERLAKRRKALVNRQARRMIIQKRSQERRRLSRR